MTRRGDAYWEERWAKSDAYSALVSEQRAEQIDKLAAVVARALCPMTEPCSDCGATARRAVEALDADGVVFARLSKSDE